MKVLHLGKYYPPVKGGIETHVRDVCEGLVKRRQHVACVVSSASVFGSSGNVKGVNVVRLSKLPFVRHPVNLSLFSYLKKVVDDFDVVHLHLPNPWAELACLRVKPKRLFVSYHADVVGKLGSSLYLPLQRKVLRVAEKIVVASPHLLECRALQEFRNKCVVIPFGVDMRKQGRFDRKIVSSLRNHSRPIFLFVGRLVKYKGLKYLVKAMKRVKGTLIIVGSGPLLNELRIKARYGNILFYPDVSDAELRNFYRACDVFVLPSITKAEAFGIVQLEAMACKKPVISTKLGTGVEFVNETGILVPPADVDALVEAMNKLQDWKLRALIGRRSFERVAKEFNSDLMLDRLLDLYSS